MKFRLNKLIINFLVFLSGFVFIIGKSFGASTDSLPTFDLNKVLDTIFQYKQQEYLTFIHNRQTGLGTSNIFQFQLDRELLKYWKKYTYHKENNQWESVGFKNENNIKIISSIDDYISTFLEINKDFPQIYITKLSMDDKILWNDIFGQKAQQISNTSDMIDLVGQSNDFNKERIIRAIKDHVAIFNAFVKSVPTEGKPFYNLIINNLKFAKKDKNTLEDILTPLTIYDVIFKSRNQRDGQITCILQQMKQYNSIGTHKDQAPYSFCMDYVQSTMDLLDDKLMCSSLDSLIEKPQTNFQISIPLDSMKEEYNDLAEKFARRVEKAFVDRKSVQFNYYSKELFQIVDIDDNVPMGHRDSRLDDKLAFLYDKSDIFLVGVSGSSPFSLSKNLWNGFALLVLEKINRTVVPCNIVLVTIPYHSEQHGYDHYDRMMPGVAFDPSTMDIVGLSKSFHHIKYSRDVIDSTFKWCRKNVDIFVLFKNANGTLNYSIDSIRNGAGAGYDANIEIICYLNKYFNTISSLSPPDSLLQFEDGNRGNNRTKKNPDYEAQLLAYHLELMHLNHLAETTIHDPDSWGTIAQDKSFIEFRIPFIIQDYLYNYAFKSNWGKFCTDFKIIFDLFQINELPDFNKINAFDSYENEGLLVFDQILYNSSGLAGLIPGIDNLADITGLIYASIRGNSDQMTAYTAGLAIAGAGALTIKLARGSFDIAHTYYIAAKGRFYRAIGQSMHAVSAEKDLLSLEVARLLDLDPLDANSIPEQFTTSALDKQYDSHQISYLRHDIPTDQKLSYIQILGSESKDIYPFLREKSLPQLENIVDAITDAEKRLSLSSILKKMDDATLHTLENDLAGESGEGLRTLFREKPGCVRAWEGLVDRPEWVRKNTDLLAKIADKGDDFIARVNNLYSPSVMKLPPNLKPPNSPPGIYNGIEYDIFGFPKLESFVSNNNHVVKIVMDGTNGDYIKAYNELKRVVGEGNIQFTNNYGSSFRLKQNGEWSDQIYTWHHHQDGETMMPVLQEIHQSIQNYHTGGRSIVNNNLIGLFDPPQF